MARDRKRAIKKLDDHFVIHNNKAFIHYGGTNIPHYEKSDRTFKIKTSKTTFKFFEIERKKKPKYIGSVKKSQAYQKKENAIKIFSQNLNYQQKAIYSHKEGEAILGTTRMVKNISIISSKPLRQNDYIVQLLCVVGIHDRKIGKSFRFIGYSKNFKQYELKDQHAMDYHQEEAIYSAIGSYCRYHKITKFSYKGNRFITAIEDQKLLYRKQLTYVYGRRSEKNKRKWKKV